MTPTIGRVVIFTQGERQHPAMITRVWNDIMVNLQVLFDAEPVQVRTSVPHESVAGTDMSWSWPTRVKD